MKRFVLLAAVTAVLTISPLAAAAPAAACPDPNNPCDIQPTEVPGWCKLTPFC